MSALLAPDPAVPQRDVLLDMHRMADLLGPQLTGGAARCERVNAKYRVGDSLRVVYRIEADGHSHTVACRTFAGRSRSVYRRAAAAAVPAGDAPAVLHEPDLETVFWTFPNDRRLDTLRLLAGRCETLDRLVGHRDVRAELVAYAPERAATARCTDAGGRVVAYVKVHWDALERERSAVETAHAAIGPDHPHLRLPRVLATSDADRALVLEPLPGRRLDGMAPNELQPALCALGAGLASLHRAAPVPGRSFDRLAATRLDQAARVVSQARPDCAATANALHRRLGERAASAARAPVHLHGDVNLRNALFHDDRVGLVDLEDAAAGPPAADLGFVLATLLAAHAQGRMTAHERDALAAALLDGYAAVAEPPDAATLRWHVAASALARVATPAIGRIRPTALAHLDELLTAAREELR